LAALNYFAMQVSHCVDQSIEKLTYFWWKPQCFRKLCFPPLLKTTVYCSSGSLPFWFPYHQLNLVLSGVSLKYPLMCILSVGLWCHESS
jgi:hypothetical protein